MRRRAFLLAHPCITSTKTVAYGAILLAFATVAVLFASVQFAGAQQFPTVATPSSHPALGGSSANSNSDNEAMIHHMTVEQAKGRATLRQQQIQSETARLLELATDLKAEVDKSDKNTLSLAVVKKAEEIEKLAKQVKEKMRDAQ